MAQSKRAPVDACIYIDEDKHTYRVQLDQSRTIIGNAPSSDIIIKDPRAGDFEGEFIATRRGFEFRSRGEQRITLNGQEVSGTQRLYHGDALMISSIRIRYFEVPEISDITLQFGIAGLHSSHSFFLTNQSFVRIGQTIGELRIPDSMIGDPQVALENLGVGAVYVRQIASECQTLVDGKPLRERVQVRDGAVLEMGETHIIVRHVVDVPLPAPSELLLAAPGAKEGLESDERQTAPDKIPTVPRAHIRKDSEVVHREAEQESDPSDAPTMDLTGAITDQAMAALRKARAASLEKSREARGEGPTPQPYTLRRDDVERAFKEGRPNSDVPYYLQSRAERAKKPAASRPADAPYYLRDPVDAPEPDQGKKKKRRSDDAERPYYVPKPGSEHRSGERNSPLDWMEGRTVTREKGEDGGSTVILDKDAVEAAVARRKGYYVPENETKTRTSKPKDPASFKNEGKKKKKKKKPGGKTLHDTSLGDLD